MYRRGLIISKWLDHVANILNETEFSYVFIEQLNFDAKYFKNILLPQIKKVVSDQAKQALTEKISNDCSFLQYPSIYTHHGVQLYLQNMPPDIWIPLVKIRTSNHKLPVQFYSWNIVFKPREERTCTICGSGEVGDEMHYILNCEVFNEDRKKFCLALRTTNLLKPS